MTDVVLQMTRSGDVHTEEGAPYLQRIVYALEDARRVHLVVNRVENGYEVELDRAVQRRRVLNLEASVLESASLCFLSRQSDAVCGEVVADEAAVGESTSHKVDSMSSTAAHIRDIDAR